MAAAVVCAALVLAACGGGGEGAEKADLADQDRFLTEYVQLLNASDEAGLADLLDGHPDGEDDAKARLRAYGGQGWDVTWSRNSEFQDVWQVRLTGQAAAGGRDVSVTETVSWEDGQWHLAPMDGVVPKPSGAAGTAPPG